MISRRSFAYPSAALTAFLLATCSASNHDSSQAPGDTPPVSAQGGPGPAGWTSGPGGAASYCDPSAAIAAYPRFQSSVPEIVSHIYPSGGGRDYPVIDAHTHLATSQAEEAALQQRVGLYAAVHAAWSADNTAALRVTYPSPNLVQFNLGAYLQGLDDSAIPAILAHLDEQHAARAGGIKLFKDFGLAYNDSSGKRLRVDDPRLYPIWQRAADERWTVSVHTADPDSWMANYYSNSPYSKGQLVQQLIRAVEDNPRTVFVAIHLLNQVDSEAELDQLGQYLDRYPNLYADTAARSQYLVHRDQAHVRAFFIAHQDKLLFGTDRAGGEGAANYEEELRYWETTGPTRTFYLNSQTRGLGLPPDVLEKLYYRNALRAFCGHLS